MVPYLYISSSVTLANDALNLLVRRMTANKAPRSQLLRRMRRFITTQADNFPGLCFDPLQITLQ